MKNFKQLLIWQKGMTIWVEAFKVSSKIPKEYKYELSGQINRAASSIPANIAEGSSRKSQKYYARFIQISMGSRFELETYLLGLIEIGLFAHDNLKPMLDLLDEEQKMLISFQNKLELTSGN
jgi:four helix bundle protein